MPHMSEDDQKAFKLYGKAPAKNMLSEIRKERKYFDSGDYMMVQAGVPPSQPLGTAIPTRDGVPHASLPSDDHLSSSPTGQPIHFPPFPVPLVDRSRQDALNRSASLAPMGVGMQTPKEAKSIPGSRHRRGSESQSQTSPQGPVCDLPPSSDPVQTSSGSLPAKTRAQARCTDQDTDV